MYSGQINLLSKHTDPCTYPLKGLLEMPPSGTVLNHTFQFLHHLACKTSAKNSKQII